MFADATKNHIYFRRFDVNKDLPPLFQLLTEIEQVDHTGECILEETLEAQLTLPGHDPLQDRWVVTSDAGGQMVGFSSVWKIPQNSYADVYVGVHPTWRRQGIGSELLQRTLIQAQTHQPQNILIYTDAQHRRAKEFLQRRSFSLVAVYTVMRLASTVDLPQPVFPTGYTLRAYNPNNDFSLLLDMYNRAFQGLWGHWEHVSVNDLKGILEEMNPEGIFLLFTQNGEIVGTCRGEISELLSKQRGVRTGYLDAPGVVPEYRSKNLYLPQLLHVANWVRKQEHNVVTEMESWGDDSHVLIQYQQMGFEIMHQQDLYRWQGQ